MSNVNNLDKAQLLNVIIISVDDTSGLAEWCQGTQQPLLQLQPTAVMPEDQLPIIQFTQPGSDFIIVLATKG